MRGGAAVLACALLAACARPAPQSAEAKAAPARTLESEPREYRARPLSAAAGADYFGETGLGDPYHAGFPYPVMLAVLRAYPDDLGPDFATFTRRFGFLSREGSELPVGFHLATDPNTDVAFVMMACTACHAERLRLPQGEVLVPGLGNKRVRIHAYDGALMRAAADPGFTVERLLPLARELAREKGLSFDPDYAKAVVGATVRNLKDRARLRGPAVARLEGGMPGRVATIESFSIALQIAAGRVATLPPSLGWSRVPDVRSARYKDTLSFDGVGTGAPTALVVEADLAVGARPEWFDAHRHLGTSLYLYLKGFDRKLPFPGAIDAALARKGHDLFVTKCAGCHGRYEEGGAVAYRERVIPQPVLGTDPLREQAVTPEFVAMANAVPVAAGLTEVHATGGYVPPPLVDVWMRAPFGHAGQWPSLRAMATRPELRPVRFVVKPDAPYDLDAVGVATGTDAPPAPGDYLYDGHAPGFDVGGHPFLADLGPDAAAVIEYLKGL